MSLELLTTIVQFILFIVRIYSIGMIIYIFMSWLPGARESIVGQYMAKIYEPYLEIFRRFIPPLGMIDLSPIVAFIVLNLFSQGIVAIYQFIINQFY
ncbi:MULTISPECIES: YggT family protein [unclassified Staphylococcus]|uniref:YggT family protein n=1 Tax=unclassified Staphylococcus TaxID=91994 RepID=UPI0021CEF338|nr:MULTISPECIES: YggT family protein [unclassified Staphylococcus]UXR70322.1 YggT family protein [Staphylococcus sp. IVB6246]UXR72388.1 YggT family protein [Staphylococcus sp. IVB6240]UXR74693.1 YggT family protein [Staphylococcus sp. IVB6238]UXR77025.1 YggT family protein [Staphylococcus sp. IVB6233]UXR81150.1 YggT family protein [Staphylococcus sp. IVB6218]